MEERLSQDAKAWRWIDWLAKRFRPFRRRCSRPGTTVGRFMAAALRHLPVLCPPPVAGCCSSLLYLSLTRRRAAPHTGRIGPHGATMRVFPSAPHRGSPGVVHQMQNSAFGDPRREYSVWDRSSPPEANEFLGFAVRNLWTALFKSCGAHQRPPAAGLSVSTITG